MADLGELDRASSTKIAGSDLTGLEDNFMNVDSNGSAYASLRNASGSALDYNYGAVGAATLRIAAQIGNATGAANFGNGATGAQTLRTTSNLSDGAGTALTSTLINSKQRLDVDLTFSGQDNTTAPFYTGQVGGQDATGKLQAFITATSGEQFVKDIINVSSQYKALSVTTTATLAVGGASALLNRKFISITPTNGTVYWGTSNAVTIASGSPIFKNQTKTLAFSDLITVYLIGAATVDVRIVEGG